MKRMTTRIAFLNLYLVTTFLWTTVLGAQDIGKPLDIKFTAVDGREVDLSKMKGKVVLIDFWATWCGPCVAELPNVKKTYEKLHPEGFEIVGISLDTSEEKLKTFVSEQEMPWPQHFDGKGWDNAISSAHGIRSIPAMWLVDKEGNLADKNARGSLEEKVEKLLAATVTVVSPVWADLFPKTMMDKNDNNVDRDTALGNKIVGIYFSASWCPPCRTFSPLLVDFRNKHAEEFEVVFASADNTKQEQLDYMKDKKMDFPAVECKTNDASKLYDKFGITGIPTLVIVSPLDGSTITTEGRSDVTYKPDTALAEWKTHLVDKPPSISNFTGGSAFVGGQVTLQWNISGATALSISPSLGNVSTSSNSVNVTPDSTTLYTLTAANDTGTVTASARALIFPKAPDDVWTVLEEVPAEATDVFPLGSEWSYFHPLDGADPIEQDSDFYTTWMKGSGYDGPGFKQSGKAILGYGVINKAPGIATNIGQPPTGARYTAYFKREFTISQNVDLGLEMLSDDGAIVYIDGKEMVRTSNLSTPDAFHGLTSNTGNENATILYGMGSAGVGSHTIAVSVHNRNVTSSDIGFDLRLFSIAQTGEFANWSTESGLSNRPSQEQAMDADPDLDGRPNLLEYALGGDPLAPDQDELLETSADSSTASLTFVRIKNSLDDAMNYKVQLCPDLSSAWQDGVVKIEGAADGVDQTELPDGKVERNSRFERIRATFTQDPTTPLKKAFLRVVVSRD